MATVKVITPIEKQGKTDNGPMQYDPFNKGYGHGNIVFERGVQPIPTGSYRFLYWMANHEAVYRTCRQILKMYHFREGLEWTNQAKYPDLVRDLNEFFESVNQNDQTFLEILFELEDDFNIADDAYLCFNRNYIVDRVTGEIIYSHIKELYRGNPLYIRLVSRDDSRIGGVYGRCLSCEGRRWENKTHYEEVLRNQFRYKSGHTQNIVFLLNSHVTYDPEKNYHTCPICGGKLHDVIATANKEMDTEEPIFFYIKEEIVHGSKYSPSLLYGTSPIVTISNQMDSRMRLSQYLQSFLEYNRAPQGAIFINTGNAEQVKQTLEQAAIKYSQDRYYLPILAIDSQTSGTIAQYIKFTPLPEELQMIDVGNQLRREICAMLGVQNVMVNDLEGVGGLNSESLQVQVTDRAALAGQVVYNTKIFPRLLKKLGEYGQYDIPFDLSLIVKRTDNAENEIRMVNLERSINLALSIMDMGYEAVPDFTNLLGYDNKKLLPFTFRKLSKEEIRENLMLGVMDEAALTGERADTVTTPSAPGRAKIPAFRTKQLLERNDDPIETGFITKVDDKGKKYKEIYYGVHFTDFEWGYISKEAYEDIKQQKDEIKKAIKQKEQNETIERKFEEFMETASPMLKDILWGASALKTRYPMLNTVDLIKKSVEANLILMDSD